MCGCTTHIDETHIFTACTRFIASPQVMSCAQPAFPVELLRWSRQLDFVQRCVDRSLADTTSASLRLAYTEVESSLESSLGTRHLQCVAEAHRIASPRPRSEWEAREALESVKSRFCGLNAELPASHMLLLSAKQCKISLSS